MGLVPNRMRPREQRLPLYHKIDALHAREPSSDDGYQASDDDSDGFLSDEAHYSSRNGTGLLSKPSLLPLPRKKTSFYPYRLPSRLSRCVFLCVGGTILVMILSLVRASQVENWKVANGKVGSPPAPPPVWEKFDFLERYYGGIKALKSLQDSRPQYPVAAAWTGQRGQADDMEDKTSADHAPDETGQRQSEVWESKPWDQEGTGKNESDMKECFLDASRTIRPPSLRYYQGRPSGLPHHVVGSYEALGLAQDVCLERFGRYGPYGFGYSVRTGGLGIGQHGEREGSEAVWDSRPRVDYREIDWADVQRRCFEANADRFNKAARAKPAPHGFYIADGGEADGGEADGGEAEGDTRGNWTMARTKVARTAVVIRCWDDFFFGPDDVANLRAMISELCLASGGRYDIHLLVQVKQDGVHPIWADDEAYRERVRASIPAEFQGLVTLWTETQMLSLYQGIYDLWSRGPDLPVHGVYRGLTMAMQYFAQQHAEYEYYWQWEMDVRYTGHYHDLVSKIEQWAKAQPRKGLWERNARFYVPAVHGSWEDFWHMSRVQSDMGRAGGDGMSREQADKAQPSKAVWGPLRPQDSKDWFETDHDAEPETAPEADGYQWGVGEEADLISLNPIFDPEGTTWALRNDITGFNASNPLPPRRAAIMTTVRMSRRLLMAMHRATAYKKQFAFAEMWPATVALHHGFKAVYAPHPVYVDRRWPLDYLAQTLNGGRDGSSGGSRTSLYGEREHNTRGLTWFYGAGFAPNLYRRWLGLRVNNDGGHDFETTLDSSKHGPGVQGMSGGEGRMCLPPMLLHPVKDVELPVEEPPPEQQEAEHSVPQSDPSA
ncbi:hypothetical protein CDD81_2165 [Ophiocordyceps australis]|uniref:Uncharacterized protein n=1 Tax=Ophiocordyceps australis TaxID=1399860 RepID=A0A2C5XX87_9HYPO|nr:hypothetical protein CDD81_2165 [Ophiocordyceps australis]